MTIALCGRGMYLGRGCNSLTGALHGEALLFDEPQPIVVSGGQEINFNLRIIEDSKQLAQALNISLSGSVSGYGLNASAEVKYLSEQNVSKYCLYALASVTVMNAETTIRNCRLKPEVEERLRERGKDGWNRFKEIYGSEYMSGVITGGSYYGLIQVETQDASERQQLSADLSASLSRFGKRANLDSSAEREIKNALQSKWIRVTILQSGGNGDPLETTLEEMIEQAQNFPQIIRESPIPYQGIFNEYARSIDLPVIKEPSSDDVTHTANVLEELGRQYLKYKDLRADIGFILKNHLSFEKYQSLSPEDWEKARARLRKDFKGVSKQTEDLLTQARKCRNSHLECHFPDSYYELTEELPELEGQNMVVRQMEDQISDLRKQIESLRNTISNNPLKQLVAADNNNIGIGTQTPTAKLHVGDRGKSVDLTIEVDVDNINTAHQPSLTLKQEGGQINGKLGFFSGNDDFQSNHNAGNSITLKKNKEINLSGDKLTISGTSPFVVREFGPFSGQTSHNTGYSTDYWEALVGGFKASGGDIQEDGSGNIIEVSTWKKMGSGIFMLTSALIKITKNGLFGYCSFRKS